MSLNRVQKALLQRLHTSTIAAGTFIVPENVTYRPPSRVPWMRVHFVPVTSDVLELGVNGRVKQDGFLQVEISAPADTGTNVASELSDAVASLYKPGNILDYDGQEVRIRRTERTQGKAIDSQYKVYLTIYWYALTSN